ncbi:flagellar protein FlaG [Pseudomonas oryzihabitans]|uniref:flagellar protein FlaG n=1 Tax=Pseudomonas oryzihabitans TaxID=47885 RepID=UPI00289E57CC|nr:flagellar protein FlaG [Pseudomonas oryzihabitans]
METGKISSGSAPFATGFGPSKLSDISTNPEASASESRQEGPVQKEMLASAVSGFKEQMQRVQRNLDFSVDDSSGQVVVKVTDVESGKVIRQIPSEEVLKLSERLEDMRSLTFGTKV